MPSETQSQLQHLLEKGLHLRAKKLLQSFLKRKRPTPQERIWISESWLRLGDPLTALKVLQKAKATKDLEIQVCEARLLNLLGAERASLRKLGPLESRLSSLSSAQLRTAAEIFLTQYRFEQALVFAERLSAISSDLASYRSCLDLILYADVLEGVGRWKEAVAITDSIARNEKFQGTILEAIARQAQGEYWIKSGEKFDSLALRKEFEISARLFSEASSNKDKAILWKWMGALEILDDKPMEARVLLERALEVFLESKSRTVGLIEVLGWLRQARPLNLQEQLLFFASDLRSPWQPTSTKNSIRIINGQLEEIDYEKLFGSVELDFVEPSHWNDTDRTLAYFLITEGAYGISLASLIDRLYDFDFVSYEQGVKRIEARLARLQRVLPLRRTQNWVYLIRIPESCVLIRPADVEKCEVLWLKRKNCDFSPEDVSLLLRISVSSARTRLNRWKEKGFL